MTTMQRIAEAMGCVPADDDDLVEAVRLLVSERDAAVAAERARCAAVCREVGRRRKGGLSTSEHDAACAAADACAEAIERGAGGLVTGGAARRVRAAGVVAWRAMEGGR